MKERILLFITVIFIVLSVVSCQAEKFTEKGIPEVETTGVTIYEEGATFFAEIITDGGKTVTERGFTWTKSSNPSAENAEYILLGPADGSRKFSVTVNSAIRNGEVYNLRAFIVAGGISSYGNLLTFTGEGSKPAILDSVTPGSGVMGDTVVIHGGPFSYRPSICSVHFGYDEGIVVSSTYNEIRAIIPPSYDSDVKIKVTIDGIESSNTIDFRILEPVLIDFSPGTGTFDDLITLSGNNFALDSTLFSVHFNTVRAKVTGVTRTRCTVLVPAALNAAASTISMRYRKSYSFPGTFTLEQAVINDVSPSLISYNGTVVITGENFNPEPGKNIVLIGDRQAQVISSSASEIIVAAPPGLIGGMYKLSVTTIEGSPVEWQGTIEVKTVWSKMADFPGGGRVGGSGFASGDKFYFGTGYEYVYTHTKDFWLYDPATDVWSRKSDCPVSIAYATGLSANGMGYLALGKLGSTQYKLMMRYDPETDKWTQMTQRPGDGSTMDAPGFVIDGKIYVPAAGNMYMYNPLNDSWTQKSYPGELGYLGGGAAFAINGKGYLGVGWVHERQTDVNDFFEYDPVTDTWIRRTSFPGTLRANSTSFSLPNGKGYVCMGYSDNQLKYLDDIWEYDPVTDQWTQVSLFPGTPRFGARAYVIGPAAYIVSGSSGNYEKDIWRFSPED